MKTKFMIFCIFSIIFIDINAQNLSQGYLEGKGELIEKDFSSAIILLEKVSEENRNIYYYKDLGLAYFEQKNYQKAIENFEKAGDFLSVAKSAWQNKDENKAVEYLRRYLLTENKVSESKLFSDKDLEGIEFNSIFKKMYAEKEYYNERERKIAKIESLYERKSYTEALFQIENMLKQGATNWKLYYFRAKINYELKKTTESISDFEKVASIQSKNILILEEIADYLYNLGEYSLASSIISKAIKLNPYELSLYIKRAKFMLAENKILEAEKDLNFYSSYVSENAEIQNLKANLNLRTGELQDALKIYDSLIEKDRKNVEYYISRSEIYGLLEDFEKALLDINQILDLQPNNGIIWIKRGDYLMKNDLQKDACLSYKRAFELGEELALEKIYRFCK